MQPAFSQSRLQQRVLEHFGSPATTSADELVALRDVAQALSRGARRKLQTQLAGGEASRILGRGLDFAEVRSYQPGDDVRMIDWKVTARTHQTHTKLFVEERERPLFIVVDCRAGMRFATRQMFKSVMAARLASLLGWCAVANNDRVGGVVFGDRRHIEIKPQAGRRGLMMLFRAIEREHDRTAAADNTDATAPPQTDAAPRQNSETILLPQLTRLRHIVHAGSSVCLFSDFTGFDAACEAQLGALARSTDMLGVMIEDPLDYLLPPPGQYTVATHSGRLSFDTHSAKIRRFYQHRQQQLGLKLERFFSGNRSRMITLSTAADFVDAALLLLARSRIAR